MMEVCRYKLSFGYLLKRDSMWTTSILFGIWYFAKRGEKKWSNLMCLASLYIEDTFYTVPIYEPYKKLLKFMLLSL